MSGAQGELVPHDGGDGKQVAGGNVELPAQPFIRTDPTLDMVRAAIASQTLRGGAASNGAIVELLIDDAASLRTRLNSLQSKYDELQDDHLKMTNELTRAQTLLEASYTSAFMGKACIVLGGLCGSIAVEVYQNKMVGASLFLAGLAVLSTILGLLPTRWIRIFGKGAP